MTTREHEIAIMEANIAHDSENYFKARHEMLDTRERRVLFDSAYKRAWQACQDLNNKERESLIAENAMMREALQDAEESLSRFTSDEGCIQEDFDTCDHVHHAIVNTKPRLVEVGEVVGDSDDNTGRNFWVFNPNENFKEDLFEAVTVYTIQKGPKT